MSYQSQYQQKLTTLEKAAASIKDNTTVHCGCAGTIATDLVNILLDNYKQFDNLTIFAALALRPLRISPELRGHIRLKTYFVGPFERMAIQMGLCEFSSVHFSTMDIWHKEIMPSDVVVFETAPMDENGYFNGGVIGSAYMRYIMENKARVIIQVNDKVPWVYGEDNLIHIDQVDMVYEVSNPPGVLPNPEVTDTDRQIASHFIDLIKDGSTLQLGVGGTANAVGYMLDGKKDLGIHTEMLTDSMVLLAKKGIFNGSKYNLYPNKLVTSVCLGGPELYAFMDRNENVLALPMSKLVAPALVERINNFVSINNALAVDLTGQVASEGLGFKQFSTTGGQLDFVRGCLRNPSGISIICLPSTAVKPDGSVVSRINLAFEPGTPITTPRSDVMYVATEFGCVNLWGQPANKRAAMMIDLAHPDFRDELSFQAKKVGLLY